METIEKSQVTATATMDMEYATEKKKISEFARARDLILANKS